MKSFTQYLSFNLPERMAFVNITDDVEACVRQSGVREGLVLVNAMHIHQGHEPRVVHLCAADGMSGDETFPFFRKPPGNPAGA